MRTFVATLSAVDPNDNVTRREFHKFDGARNETILVLDSSATIVSSDLDETLGAGSCYLVDVNPIGNSDPSPAFALVPTIVPPPPPPNGVPKTPGIESVDWQAE